LRFAARGPISCAKTWSTNAASVVRVTALPCEVQKLSELVNQNEPCTRCGPRVGHRRAQGVTLWAGVKSTSEDIAFASHFTTPRELDGNLELALRCRDEITSSARRRRVNRTILGSGPAVGLRWRTSPVSFFLVRRTCDGNPDRLGNEESAWSLRDLERLAAGPNSSAGRRFGCLHVWEWWVVAMEPLGIPRSQKPSCARGSHYPRNANRYTRKKGSCFAAQRTPARGGGGVPERVCQAQAVSIAGAAYA
jgi:hypothetical protein